MFQWCNETLCYWPVLSSSKCTTNTVCSRFKNDIVSEKSEIYRKSEYPNISDLQTEVHSLIEWCDKINKLLSSLCWWSKKDLIFGFEGSLFGKKASFDFLRLWPNPHEKCTTRSRKNLNILASLLETMFLGHTVTDKSYWKD